MADILKVKIWRTVNFNVPSFSSLHCYHLMDIGQVQMPSVDVFTFSECMSSGGGVFPCTKSTKWLPDGNNK
jgi:hypothetical protein